MADQWDSKLDVDKDSDIATELKIYNVELTNKILDTGSFGSFVEAWWYGGPCVAKQVHSKFFESSHSEDFIRSFSHECVTWAKLKHPHIVPLLGLFQTEPSTLPLLVMERMDASLTTLLEDCRAGGKRLSLQQKVSILLQVSSGLAYLHQWDPPAVHGDLSANNVLITLATLTAKISDFGIARSLQFTSEHFPTHTSQLYSPPEVLEPALEEFLTAEVDTFSYGVLIIHVVNLQLTRLLPSRMKKQPTKELVLLNEFQRRRNDLDLFPERERSLFMDLIEKCLEFSPEDRPNSLALVSNLQEIQSEVEQPHPYNVTVVPKVSNEDCRDSHPIQSPTGLDEVEPCILENECQLEKYTEEVEAKEEMLNRSDENFEEMTKTIQEKNQMKSENEKQFKKEDTIMIYDDNEPLPNPFPRIKLEVSLKQQLLDRKLTVTSMRQVAKRAVEAMRVYSTHPKPNERKRVARDIIGDFPVLATPGSNLPESGLVAEIAKILKEKNRKRRTSGLQEEFKVKRDGKEREIKKDPPNATKLPQIKKEDNIDGKDTVSYERHVKRLQEEYTKPKSSEELVMKLMAATFKARREWITNEGPHISQVLEQYPFLGTITQFKNEIQMLMGGRIEKTARMMEKVLQNRDTLGITQMGKSKADQEHLSLLGLRTLHMLTASKQGKVDPNDVCREIPGNMPLEEAALAEQHPVIMYTKEQAWLVMGGRAVMSIPPAEAPEMLLSAYYIFNVAYTKTTKTTMTILEKLVFKKYITAPGLIAIRTYHLLQSYS